MKLGKHSKTIYALARELIGSKRVKVRLGERSGPDWDGGEGDLCSYNLWRWWLADADLSDTDLHETWDRADWIRMEIPDEGVALLDFYVYTWNPQWGDELEDNLIVQFQDGMPVAAWATYRRRASVAFWKSINQVVEESENE